MALEDFIIDLCQESVSGALLVRCFVRTCWPTDLTIFADLLALSDTPT